jgi:hypothetical protein
MTKVHIPHLAPDIPNFADVDPARLRRDHITSGFRAYDMLRT